jgi:hypothetical protein
VAHHFKHQVAAQQRDVATVHEITRRLVNLQITFGVSVLGMNDPIGTGRSVGWLSRVHDHACHGDALSLYEQALRAVDVLP